MGTLCLPLRHFSIAVATISCFVMFLPFVFRTEARTSDIVEFGKSLRLPTVDSSGRCNDGFEYAPLHNRYCLFRDWKSVTPYEKSGEGKRSLPLISRRLEDSRLTFGGQLTQVVTLEHRHITKHGLPHHCVKLDMIG